MPGWRAVMSVLATIGAVLLFSAFGATSAGTKPYDAGVMASWVQAIGSIGAIVGAFVLGRWQSAEQANRDKAERLERDHAAVQAVYDVAEDLVKICEGGIEEVARDGRQSPLNAGTFNAFDQVAKRHIGALDSAPGHDPVHAPFLRDMVVMSSYGRYFLETAKGATVCSSTESMAVVRRLDEIGENLKLVLENYKGRVDKYKAEHRIGR